MESTEEKIEKNKEKVIRNMITLLDRYYKKKEYQTSTFFASNLYYLIRGIQNRHEHLRLIYKILKSFFKIEHYSYLVRLCEEEVFCKQMRQIQVQPPHDLSEVNYFEEFLVHHQKHSREGEDKAPWAMPLRCLRLFSVGLMKLGYHRRAHRVLMGKEDGVFLETIQPIQKHFPSLFKKLVYTKGKAYLKLNNVAECVKFYKMALAMDPCDFTIFNELQQAFLMPRPDLKKLVLSLQANMPDEVFLLYMLSMSVERAVKDTSKANPVEHEANVDESLMEISKTMQMDKPKESEKQNADMMVNVMVAKNYPFLLDCVFTKVHIAESLYNKFDFYRAYSFTKSVLKLEKFEAQSRLVIVHSNVLLAMDKKSELFELSHELLEISRDDLSTLYCLGCYYYSIGEYEKAIAFNRKCTRRSREFIDAWIAMGHCHSLRNNSDMAIEMYRTAHILFPNSESPLLNLGQEYIKLGNYKIAEVFLEQAMDVSLLNPQILHELGVVKYKQGEYVTALRFFQRTAELRDHSARILDQDTFWHVLYFNMGNTYRKMKNWEMAIKFYNSAIELHRMDPSYFAALGYAYHLKEDYDNAVLNYHTSLELFDKPGVKEPTPHYFTTHLLKRAMESAMQEMDKDVMDTSEDK